MTRGVAITLLSAGLLWMALSGDARAEERSLEERVSLLEQKVDVNESNGAPIFAYWKNGFRLQSEDKAFQLKLGGRVQVDAAWFDEDDEFSTALSDPEDPDSAPTFEDGSEIRRARFYASGTLHEHIEFKVQFDLSSGGSDARDVYLGMRNIPYFGTIRVGHQREPFARLQQSSKYYTFMERSFVSDLTEGRNTGVRALNSVLDGRATWSAGVYSTSDSTGSSGGNGDLAFTARLSGLPWEADGAEQRLHLGVACSSRTPPDDETSFDARPDSHLAPKLVDTGDIAADHIALAGFEAALQLSSFSILGEYTMATVDAIEGPELDFSAYYLEVAYILTGESRYYDHKTGGFRGVAPDHSYRGEEGGAGAWEIAARYSGIDLSDGEVAGGELEDVSFALNWYLNFNTRVMLNYVMADLEGVGEVDIVQTRFQVFF